MRVLMHLNDLGLGGSQLNAVDLGRTLRDRGHEVRFCAASAGGVVEDIIRGQGMDVTRLPPATGWPAPRTSRALDDLAREYQVDLVHAFEWQQALDALYGPHGRRGVPLVITVMSMTVPRWLPRDASLTVGTREIARRTAQRRPGPVWTLHPPIDTSRDHPGVPGEAFRRAAGAGPSDLLGVVVTRLAEAMKLEGVERAIAAVTDPGLRGMRLAIVGDGDARPVVAALAARANEAVGSRAVTLVGAKSDPRPAYAGADVVVGMGSSALRGMAFGRPVVVVGEDGFCATVDHDSLPGFLDVGFFGRGRAPGRAGLAEQLRTLAGNPAARDELSELGRRTVEAEFSLERGASRLEETYERALGSRTGVAGRLRTVVRVTAHRACAEAVAPPVRYGVRRLIDRLGPARRAADPVAATSVAS